MAEKTFAVFVVAIAHAGCEIARHETLDLEFECEQLQL